jgi:hypothetical protein
VSSGDAFGTALCLPFPSALSKRRGNETNQKKEKSRNHRRLVCSHFSVSHICIWSGPSVSGAMLAGGVCW